jgi:NAD(P)-dependent dehydrogenase (short-subunit alcohol dehydrogenase family)
MPKVWFITGASKGFGREFAIVALERGDQVAATARDTSSLDDLLATYGDAILPITLDVTDKAADGDAIRQAHERFGRLDIVINNAGYGQFGTVEELSEADLRDQLETNFFGAIWITQAALPILRAQGSGHIIQVTSVGGIGAFPNVGAYHASKWALEGITESLAQEVAPFGIKVTLVEPAGFSTDWAGPSSRSAEPMPEYQHVREARARQRSGFRPGDPKAAAQALLDIVDAGEPPLRVLFGSQAPEMIYPIYERRLQTWRDWEATSKRAQG